MIIKKNYWNSIMHLRLLAIFGFMFAGGLMALNAATVLADEHDTDSGPVIIIEDSEGSEDDATNEGEGASYLEKHFGGEIISSYAGIGDSDNSRANIQARLRIQDDWSWGLAALELIGYHSDVRLTLGRGLNQDQDLRTQRFEESDYVLREAYVQLDPTSWWRVIAGRQVVTIGQFDIFSPVDFVLPVDFTNTRLSYNKVEYRLPQDALRNNFYFGNWRFETVYYPTLLRGDLSRLSQAAPRRYYDPTIDEYVAVSRRLPKNEEQYLLRLVYEGEKATVGFTYYDGFDLFVFSDPRSELERGSGPRGEWVYRRILPDYEKRRAYGFEVARQVNKYSVKFEVLAEKAIEELDFLPNEASVLNNPQNEYLNFIRDENDGHLYITRDQYIAALGFDYYGDKNFFNVYLVAADNSLDEKGSRAKAFAERAYPGNEATDFGGVFPALNIGGYYGERNQHTVGLITGFLSFAQGVSIYYLNDFYESFQYGISMEAFQYLSNSVLEDQANNEDDDATTPDPSNPEPDLQLPEEVSVGFRVGFEYSF